MAPALGKPGFTIVWVEFWVRDHLYNRPLTNILTLKLMSYIHTFRPTCSIATCNLSFELVFFGLSFMYSLIITVYERSFTFLWVSVCSCMFQWVPYVLTVPYLRICVFLGALICSQVFLCVFVCSDVSMHRHRTIRLCETWLNFRPLIQGSVLLWWEIFLVFALSITQAKYS